MTDGHRALADKVVEAFRSSLSETARAALGESDYDKLAQIISEALSEELNSAAEIVDDAARRLRAAVERPELEL
ncbi:MAG: hypothetical protein JSW10_11610 [Pseudomonadota bacterium]|nr:MAG: hypothetical protein JSW10_11610 [Pseudomonadota bacterium]